MTANYFFSYTEENIHPGFSVDCLLIRYYKKELQVCLFCLKDNNLWHLPGGFLFKEESADDAAQRILGGITGLKDIYLKQFYLFSNPKRTVIEQNKDLISIGIGGEFLLRRYLSLGYYAFVRWDEVETTNFEGIQLQWFNIFDLPQLYSDHKLIIEKALEIIRVQIHILPVGYELLHEKFTIYELRKIYEIIQGVQYDRRNFQRKLLASNLLTALDETRGNNASNSPKLYSFSRPKEQVSDYAPFLSFEPFDK